MKTVTTTKLEITDADLHAVSTLFNRGGGDQGTSHVAARDELLSEVRRLMQGVFSIRMELVND